MCGIYGILDKSFNGLTDGDLSVFGQMGTVTELRGRHSSGIFCVGGKGEPGPVVKTVGPSVNLLFEKGYDKFKTAFKNGRALIGHGRFATVGKVTKNNAHPFREHNLTLVHNGTIREGLNMQNANVEVDSHALVKLISEKGLKDAIGSLKGAWAIMQYDAQLKRVQILRNWERDLHYAEGPHAIYIMSEAEALEYLLKRNRSNYVVKPFEANTLYQFDIETKELIKGERIEGDTSYIPYQVPAQTVYQEYLDRQYGKRTWRPFQSSSNASASPAVEELARDYEIGDEVTFAVRGKVYNKGITVFKAMDDRNNTIVFTSGNRNAANISIGAKGKAKVSAISWDYQTKLAGYSVRYREIEWEKEVVDSVVTTYGGFEIKQSEWELLCSTQQCWSCQGALDADAPDKTVLVLHGSTYKPYCPDCVEDYRSIYGQKTGPLNEADRSSIADTLSRISQ